ncbi:MAG: flagellar assembly protein T N-terminal domain-containing protein [Myxococcaceae bacterium]
MGLVQWALVALLSGAAPEVISKEASGEAAIVNGNKERAEKEARDLALREAVEQVAGVIVSASTLTSNAQLISDQVFSRSEGYVRSYEVLSKKEERGVMKVTVRALVGTAKLDKDLQAVRGLVERLRNTKVVILLQEQTIDDKGVTTTSGVMASALTKAFAKDGWSLIDPQFAAGKVKVSSAVALGAVEAKEIGDMSKADYILYGTSSFRDAPKDSFLVPAGGEQGVFVITGEYDLGVFATDSGQQIAKVSGKLMPSLKEVSINSRQESAFNLVTAREAEIVGHVRKAVVESLRDAESKGKELAVRVVGISDFAALQNFKKELQRWAGGVRDIRGDSLAGGEAKMSVLYLGTSDRLADDLGGKKFRGKKVSVTGISGNALVLTLAK